MNRKKLPGYFYYQYRVRTEGEVNKLLQELKDKIQFMRLKTKYNELQNVQNLQKGITKAARLKEDYKKWIALGKPEKFIA